MLSLDYVLFNCNKTNFDPKPSRFWDGCSSINNLDWVLVRSFRSGLGSMQYSNIKAFGIEHKQ